LGLFFKNPDDESLIDEAIAATYDRMISIDPVRAEQVMSLIIRRHADAKDALKDSLSQDRQRSCRNYNKPSSLVGDTFVILGGVLDPILQLAVSGLGKFSHGQNSYSASPLCSIE
jgi:hypothetical protein